MKNVLISSGWKRLLIAGCATLVLCATGLLMAAFLFTFQASAMEQPASNDYEVAHDSVLGPNAGLALQGTIRPELVGHWRQTETLNSDTPGDLSVVTDYHLVFGADGTYANYYHSVSVSSNLSYEDRGCYAVGNWSATETIIRLVASNGSTANLGYQISNGDLKLDNSNVPWELIGAPGPIPEECLALVATTPPPTTEVPTTPPPTTEPPTTAPPTTSVPTTPAPTTEVPTTPPPTTEPPTTAPPTTSVPATPPPTTSNGGTPGQHVVRQGETLFCIGRGYGVLPWAIATSNRLSSPYHIFPGQTLLIPNVPWAPIPAGPVCPRQSNNPQAPVTPVPTTPVPDANTSCRATYIVVRGDTLFRISRAYGVDVAALVSVNGIANSNLIYAGQRLCIP